jgi:hypothetical protein
VSTLEVFVSLLSRNDGKIGLRTVSNTVSSSNYPGSRVIYTKLFGHKNRIHVNARIGLIGDDKLHLMLMLIAVHPLLRVTLGSPRHQHVHPQRYGLKTVRRYRVFFVSAEQIEIKMLWNR